MPRRARRWALRHLSQTRTRGIAAALHTAPFAAQHGGIFARSSDMETYDAGPQHPRTTIEHRIVELPGGRLARAAGGGSRPSSSTTDCCRSSDSWEAAFDGAFGMTVEDFYAAFEAYRADGFTS